MSSNIGSNVFPIGVAVVIIVISIGITSAIQGSPDKAMSQIVTVGPVWSTDAWQCTSDADFIVHATLRGIGIDPLPLIAVSVQDHGTQSFFSMDNSESVAFSVGNEASKTVIITRTGTVTGFLTLQTTSNAEASCIAI